MDMLQSYKKKHIDRWTCYNRIRKKKTRRQMDMLQSYKKKKYRQMDMLQSYKKTYRQMDMLQSYKNTDRWTCYNRIKKNI